MNFYFEWDQKKATSNYRKHGVTFLRASEVFADPFALSIFDDDHSHAEDRWITIGKTKEDAIIVVIHAITEFENKDLHIRLISARKATKMEQKQYLGIKS